MAEDRTPGNFTARLDDRGVVAVSGPDAAKFLQGLITNDIDLLDNHGAIFAGLLSPQGKILFEFFVAKAPGGFVLELARDRVTDLIKRLTMYKLRASLSLSDESENYATLVVWGDHACSSGDTIGTIAFADPRQSKLGLRILAEVRFASDIASATNGRASDIAAYDAHRVALGVPEGGKDYAFGDAVPHDANYDLLAGVSFTKGCFVGQEVVARMHNKSVVRKRVARVSSKAPSTAELTGGADVILGTAVIGKVGTVDGSSALAQLRIDRVVEAMDNAIALTANGIEIAVDPELVAAYRLAASKSIAPQSAQQAP